MAIEPESLRGLWQREIITYPDGHTDSSLRIYWMQAQNLYADFRIPFNFAPFRPDACLADLSPAEMVELARLGGFAGRIILDKSECRWIRVIDWQPYSGIPDVAQLSLEGPDLVEEGGACRGHQIWRRRTSPQVSVFGLELRDAADGRDGFLVALAGRFIYARGRRGPLNPASGLAELLTACGGDRDAARALFDAEVSYGVIDRQGAWRIELSTLPWRNGDALLSSSAALFDERLIVQERDHHGRPVSRIWEVFTREEHGGAGRWRAQEKSTIDAL